jgi:FG-GAP repeat
VSGAAQVWYLGGAQGNVVTNAVTLVGSSSLRIVSVADFNGDGHPDVIWQDPNSGASQVWFLSGTQGTTISGTTALSGPNSWRILGPR